jgi:hypothetical protein
MVKDLMMKSTMAPKTALLKAALLFIILANVYKRPKCSLELLMFLMLKVICSVRGIGFRQVSKHSKGNV